MAAGAGELAGDDGGVESGAGGGGGGAGDEAGAAGGGGGDEGDVTAGGEAEAGGFCTKIRVAVAIPSALTTSFRW